MEIGKLNYEINVDSEKYLKALKKIRQSMDKLNMSFSELGIAFNKVAEAAKAFNNVELQFNMSLIRERKRKSWICSCLDFLKRRK
jgi:hypothetical protein